MPNKNSFQGKVSEPLLLLIVHTGIVFILVGLM